MADPFYSTNLPGVLYEFVKQVHNKFREALGSDLQKDLNLQNLIVAPASTIVLPAYFFYMPEAIAWGASVAPYYGFFNNIRARNQVNFPLLAVSGRGTRQLVTIGGGVALNISYRLYLVHAAPPSQQIVERMALTASYLSRVVLSIFHHPPFWWFTEVTEEDVITRPESGEWTVAYISGNIRGCPHVIPAILVSETS